MYAPYAIFRFILLIKTNVLFNVKLSKTQGLTGRNSVQLGAMRKNSAQLGTTQHNSAQLTATCCNSPQSASNSCNSTQLGTTWRNLLFLIHTYFVFVVEQWTDNYLECCCIVFLASLVWLGIKDSFLQHLHQHN